MKLKNEIPLEISENWTPSLVAGKKCKWESKGK